MDNMFNALNKKIDEYTVLAEVIEEMIERRREELKTETSDFMKGLTQGRIRELTGELNTYYKVIRELKEVRDEAFTE